MDDQELLQEFERDMCELFRCANTRKRKDGTRQISCKFGLWSVEGPDDMRLLNEAARYFFQYKADGEYDHIFNA